MSHRLQMQDHRHPTETNSACTDDDEQGSLPSIVAVPGTGKIGRRKSREVVLVLAHTMVHGGPKHGVENADFSVQGDAEIVASIHSTHHSAQLGVHGQEHSFGQACLLLIGSIAFLVFPAFF